MEKSQFEILESLTKEDFKNIILPKDDFFDEESISSSYSESEEKKEQKDKKKFRFGHNIYESYSSYYLSETVLGIDCQNVKSVKSVNINELVTYNQNLSWFNEKLFTILLDFCKNEKKNIYFNPDYIMNDIRGEVLLEQIPKFKENIHCFKHWIKKERKYDLIGEVSIDYLTNPKARKLTQTIKYIKFINLLKKIENKEDISANIKTKFEALFNLVYGNEKILVITTDGNYEQYLNNLKNSKIFKDEENIEVNNTDSKTLEILKEIKQSKINFIMIYVPRSYVNIEYNYSNEDKIKQLSDAVHILQGEVSKLKEENKILSDKIIKLTDEEVSKLKEENKILSDKVIKLTEENKDLKDKIAKITKEKDV